MVRTVVKLSGEIDTRVQSRHKGLILVQVMQQTRQTCFPHLLTNTNMPWAAQAIRSCVVFP